MVTQPSNEHTPRSGLDVPDRRPCDALPRSTADFGFSMFSFAMEVLRRCRALFRRLFADDGSGSRVDHAHGENFGGHRTGPA